MPNRTRSLLRRGTLMPIKTPSQGLQERAWDAPTKGLEWKRPHQCGSSVQCMVQGSAFRVQGSGLRVQGSGFRVQGSGLRVQGSGSRIWGFGLRVKGSGIRVEGFGVLGFWGGSGAESEGEPPPSRHIDGGALAAN